VLIYQKYDRSDRNNRKIDGFCRFNLSILQSSYEGISFNTNNSILKSLTQVPVKAPAFLLIEMFGKSSLAGLLV
jgi:hypothetical protein